MAVEKSRLDEKPEESKGGQEEKISLSPKELEELIDAKIASVSGGSKEIGGSDERMVRLLAEAINKKDYQLPDDFTYTNPADLDPEDVLEEPDIFWAPGFNVVIGDDVKNGRAIPPPVNRVVWFKPEGSKRVQRGKETDMQIFSKFKCHSKKEGEWLRNHTLYGIIFFLKGSTDTNIDVRYTQKLMEYANGMNNMESNRVVEEARKLGIVFTEEIPLLRLGIAQHKAKEYMKQFEIKELDLLKENAKADQLLKS